MLYYVCSKREQKEGEDMDRYCRKDWMVPNKIQESADLLYTATCKYIEREHPQYF